MHDDDGSGQLIIQRTDTNVDRVRNVVHSDRRLRVQQITEELGINREKVMQILRGFGNEKNFLRDAILNLES